ncbi:hypothetical protein MASR2M18_00130 [Ignavibacteria bacterium]|nr:hypothetical protein [Bacteroidota bacterium]MCZ2131788.1 hypothetical protein [Bacteroidota bacterium]
MSVQELLDKYANGTISASESAELNVMAQADPALQTTLDELRKVDELFDFPKSERGRKVIGCLDSVEIAALAAMSGAAVPIAASQSGWLYTAAGVVGAGVIAGAIWLGTSSDGKHETAVLTQRKTPQKQEQTAETVPSAATEPKISEPSAIEPKISAPVKRVEIVRKETESVRIIAKSAGENHNSRETDSLLSEIIRAGNNSALLSDLHFKTAMLYKQERNYSDAKHQLTAARTEALKINLAEKAANALGELGNIEKYNGNYSQAADMINAAIDELRPIRSPEAESAIRRWENVLRSMR